MPIGNGHWESNFFNGYFSPIVVEIKILPLLTLFACTGDAILLALGTGM